MLYTGFVLGYASTVKSLGLELEYLDWGASWLSSVSPRRCLDNILDQTTNIFYSSFFYCPSSRRYIAGRDDQVYLKPKPHMAIFTIPEPTNRHGFGAPGARIRASQIEDYPPPCRHQEWLTRATV